MGLPGWGEGERGFLVLPTPSPPFIYFFFWWEQMPLCGLGLGLMGAGPIRTVLQEELEQLPLELQERTRSLLAAPPELPDALCPGCRPLTVLVAQRSIPRVCIACFWELSLRMQKAQIWADPLRGGGLSRAPRSLQARRRVAENPWFLCVRAAEMKTGAGRGGDLRF